jgi:bifunctional UDP-N-acetylglucosamine pyrophosphorylase/glucosamine-1-phosphate N-acetyltransferase
MRDGVEIGAGVQVGNFVEVKGSSLGSGTKAKHLAYLGNATIGEDVNIGAGTITCNHDGFRKHPTTLKDGAYVGSNTTLVAPVQIGEGAYVAAGSVINRDVPSDALGIARSRPEIKEGWAARRRAREAKKREG